MYEKGISIVNTLNNIHDNTSASSLFNAAGVALTHLDVNNKVL